MKYFAIIGDNQELIQKELKLLELQNPIFKTNIITFDDCNFDILPQIAGIIKQGHFIDTNDQKNFENINLIGCPDKNLALTTKKQHNIKRFKLTQLKSSDQEIIKKGIEIIPIGKHIGVVDFYQNIDFFKTIDYEKPSRSMEMGMMPAKLTQSMINITRSFQTNKKTIIFDPFAGSGTTGLIANYLGFDFIGSDTNTNHLEKNINRFKTTKYYNSNKKLFFYKHDATKYFHFLKEYGSYQILTVTEGRLGPIVNQKTSKQQMISYQKQVLNLQYKFLSNILKNISNPIITMTIPYYIKLPKNTIFSNLKQFLSQTPFHISPIQQIYERKGQKIGRQILVIK